MGGQLHRFIDEFMLKQDPRFHTAGRHESQFHILSELISMVRHNMVSVLNSQVHLVFRVALLATDTTLSTSAVLVGLGFGDIGRRGLGRIARVLIRGGELAF